jgi:hypothetical protein
MAVWCVVEATLWVFFSRTVDRKSLAGHLPIQIIMFRAAFYAISLRIFRALLFFEHGTWVPNVLVLCLMLSWMYRYYVEGELPNFIPTIDFKITGTKKGKKHTTLQFNLGPNIESKICEAEEKKDTTPETKTPEVQEETHPVFDGASFKRKMMEGIENMCSDSDSAERMYRNTFGEPSEKYQKKVIEQTPKTEKVETEDQEEKEIENKMKEVLDILDPETKAPEAKKTPNIYEWLSAIVSMYTIVCTSSDTKSKRSTSVDLSARPIDFRQQKQTLPASWFEGCIR